MALGGATVGLNPFSQGVVRQDYSAGSMGRVRLCLNPFSQGVVRQDRGRASPSLFYVSS